MLPTLPTNITWFGPRRDADRPRRPADAEFLLEFAVAVEHLDAAIGAVGDVEIAVGVADDAVRGVELAGAGAALAPVLDQVAVLAEFGDARIAVAVGDVDAAVCVPRSRRSADRNSTARGMACSITWVCQVHGSGRRPSTIWMRRCLSNLTTRLVAASMYQRLSCASTRTWCGPSNSGKSSAIERTKVPSLSNSISGCGPRLTTTDVAVRIERDAHDFGHVDVVRQLEEILGDVE